MKNFVRSLEVTKSVIDIYWTPHREISIDEQMIGTRC